MSDEEKLEIPMAECGACRTKIPLDSESCSNCGIKFGGVSDESLGECGSCGKLQPVESESCIECGLSFVGQDTTEEDGKPSDSDVEEESDSVTLDSADEETNENDSPEEEGDDSEDDSDDASDESDDDSDVESDESDDDPDVESDESEDDESDESEDDSDDDSDDSDDESDEVEEITEDEDNSHTIIAFENLALAIAESKMTAAEAFAEMDTSEDNLIDAPELQKGIEKIGGETLLPSEVNAILDYLDTNENNRVDPNELVKALDDLKIGIKPGKMPKVVKIKEFPSPVQKFLMGKAANDIVYPIAYFLMVTFIGLWVVNGLGLMVDGTGGTILYEGHTDSMGDVEFANWDICDSDIDTLPDPCYGDVNIGESYPCDPAIDPNGCDNSLTIFSGDNGASSMPAGFYTDGIVMMILGLIGIAAVAYLHLVYAPSLRRLAKGETKTTEDEDNTKKAMMNLCTTIVSNDMSIREAFESIDTDGNGRINGPELQAGLKELAGDELSASEVAAIIGTLDENGDGTLDPMELVKALEALDMDVIVDHPTTSKDDSDDDDDESDDDDDESDDDDDESDDDDDESDDDDDESDDDDDESDEDGTDVGDSIGLEVDGKEYFGEIIEFDDDEDTVTIETDDGEEITGEQDDMFLDDDA